MVGLAEVVGGEHGGAAFGDGDQPPQANPVEPHEGDGEEEAGEGVGPAGAPSRALVELLEVLRRAVVEVVLWLHVGHVGGAAGGRRARVWPPLPFGGGSAPHGGPAVRGYQRRRRAAKARAKSRSWT